MRDCQSRESCDINQQTRINHPVEAIPHERTNRAVMEVIIGRRYSQARTQVVGKLGEIKVDFSCVEGHSRNHGAGAFLLEFRKIVSRSVRIFPVVDEIESVNTEFIERHSRELLPEEVSLVIVTKLSEVCSSGVFVVSELDIEARTHISGV